MSSAPNNDLSYIKLAKLVAAFDKNLSEKSFESILATEGDINYVVSPKKQQAKDGDRVLQPGSILHQMWRLKESTIISNVLKALLSNGVDITLKNSNGQTALHTQFLRQYEESDAEPCMIKQDSLIDAILSSYIELQIHDNPADSNGITPFQIACIVNHTRAVEFFLDIVGVDVDLAINTDSLLYPGCTALNLAVYFSNPEIVKILLDRQADIHWKNAEGLTPIYALVKKIMELADNTFDGTADEIKSEYTTMKTMISLLLTTGNISDDNNNNNNNSKSQIVPDENGFSLFHAACTLGDISFVENLLHRVRDINHAVNLKSALWPGFTALHFAACFNFHLFKYLFEKGGNIMAKDGHGFTPLDICLQRISIGTIVSFLSSQSCWKDIMFSDGKTKLIDLLITMQSEATYDSFLQQIEPVNINMSIDKKSPLWPGYTILHFVALLEYSGRAYIYEAFGNDDTHVTEKYTWLSSNIRQDMDVTFVARDSQVSPPLHFAYYLQNDEVLEGFIYCLSNQRIANFVDTNNVSTLHIVQYFDVMYVDMGDELKNLILEGAHINLPTRTTVKQASYLNRKTFFLAPVGSTILHTAVASGDSSELKFLLKHGADLNAIDEYGWTPVHYLMLHDHDSSMGKAVFSLPSKLKERVVNDIGLSHLHVACYVDNLRAVKKLLRLGSDVNAAIRLRVSKYRDHYCDDECELICKNSYNGFTPLHFSVQRRSLKIIKVLLEAGADVLARDAENKSPLHQILTTNYNSSKLINFFIGYLHNNEEQLERLNDDLGINLIHIFASIMDYGKIEELLKSGVVDINAKVRDDSPIWPGYTALHNCAHRTNELGYFRVNVQRTLKLLLDNGADITLANAAMDTPLHLFNCSLVDREFILSTGRLLLNNQKKFAVNPVNSSGISHFHISVQLYDVAMAEEFLKHGVDVNQSMGYLFNHGSTQPGYTSLHLLMRDQKYLEKLPARMEMIKLLLKYDADVNARDFLGYTPLHVVAENGCMRNQLLEKIVQAGGDVHDVNIMGETPFDLLMKSSGKITPKEIGFFLQRKCPVHVFNEIDQTGFLSLALSRTRTKTQYNDIYKTLFKCLDVRSTDDHGRTAIHNIVSSRASICCTADVYFHLIERLTKLGCDIDAQDQSGKTALHVAAEFDNKAAIAALLMNGADINIVDQSNRSAFTYAWEMPQYNLVITTILAHVISMELMQLHVSEENTKIRMEAVTKYGTNPTLVNQDQLKKMKTINFIDSHWVKLYDFLSETRAVTAYSTMSKIQRKSISKFFNTKNKVLEELSDFRGLLKLQFRKAVKRAELIEKAKDSLMILSRIYLPEICLQKLLRQLSFSDVQCLIASAENA